MLLVSLALAQEVETRSVPWGTVDVLATVDAGVTLRRPGEADGGPRPTSGAGVALLAGPALLRVTLPAGEKFSSAAAEIHGFSAGVYARLDTPRAIEEYGRTWGGYVRYGHQAPGDAESRATLAVGWRQAMGADGPLRAGAGGQLDLLVAAERRIFAPIAVTAQVGVGVGTAAMPWRLTAGAGAMVGF